MHDTIYRLIVIKAVRRWAFLIVFQLLILVTPVTAQDSEPPAATEDAPQPGPAWDGTLRRVNVPILMYHYVSPLPPNADEYRVDLTVPPDVFRAHMEYLFYEGYTPISLYQLHDALLTGAPLPSEPIVLTFDDGYIDHHTNVFPVLRELGFTATFFIITGRADAEDPLYLRWDQIREMSDAGMSMEAHTKNHPSLDGRDYDFLVYEMLGSLQSLDAYTGRAAHMFAYPVGRYDNATLSVAGSLPIWRAVTTQPGRIHTTDNWLELPRVRISGGMGVPGLASVLADR